MVSTIATVHIHLIVVVSLTGIVSHGQIHPEKENSIGNSKQSYGILMERCPKLVKPILRHVFNRLLVKSIFSETKGKKNIGSFGVMLNDGSGDIIKIYYWLR